MSNYQIVPVEAQRKPKSLDDELMIDHGASHSKNQKVNLLRRDAMVIL